MNPSRCFEGHFQGIARIARRVGRAATLALYDELALWPKPGLVTLQDCGSHDDMDADTFVRSLFALRSTFPRFAELGAEQAPFGALERCGLEAEARMRAATEGINTNRGAIFTLGLLCAAAGDVLARGRALGATDLRHALVTRWGADLSARADRPATLPGGRVAQRLGLRGASVEAALGFPVYFEVALPAWQQSRDLPARLRKLDTLFRIIAVLDDCNIAQRGGLDGLRYAQREAARYIDAGGCRHPDGILRAEALGHEFVSRRLSPGGAADMLAAVCWFERLAAA